MNVPKPAPQRQRARARDRCLVYLCWDAYLVVWVAKLMISIIVILIFVVIMFSPPRCQRDDRIAMDYLLGEVVCSGNYCRQVHQPESHTGDDAGSNVSDGKLHDVEKPVSDHDMRQRLGKAAENKTTG